MTANRRPPSELTDEELAREIEARRRARRRRTEGEAKNPPSRASADPRLRRYFANLEVPPDASLDEVRAAYLRLAEKYSPEKYVSDPEQRRAAEELARSLREAYQAIRHALGDEGTKAP